MEQTSINRLMTVVVQIQDVETWQLAPLMTSVFR